MSDEVLPEGTIIKIELEVRLPVAATAQQINEWLPYALCQSGGCSTGNPLVNEAADEWGSSLDWDDTGMIGHREEFDIVELPEGGRRYKVRYRREHRAA